MLPPSIAQHFTQGEQAALAIIVREIVEHGQCAECVDALAARGGVCAGVVQKAQRLAQEAGLLTIEERRRPGQKNLPNVIRIVSREWLAWLRSVSQDRVNKSATHGFSTKTLFLKRAAASPPRRI